MSESEKDHSIKFESGASSTAQHVEQARAWIQRHEGMTYGDRGLRLSMESACALLRQFIDLSAVQAQAREEIERLKADIAFKDSLIWTMRDSELHKAVVAAEKHAKALEARLALMETPQEIEQKDFSAGLIHQIARPLAGTLPRPNSGWSFEIIAGSYEVVDGKTERMVSESVYNGSLTEEEASAMYGRAYAAAYPNSPLSPVGSHGKAKRA